MARKEDSDMNKKHFPELHACSFVTIHFFVPALLLFIIFINGEVLSIFFTLQNKDGRVTKRDFRRVLESFCFRMTQQQFHELMAKIDPYNKGFISYLDFLDRFEQRETEVWFQLLHCTCSLVFNQFHV